MIYSNVCENCSYIFEDFISLAKEDDISSNLIKFSDIYNFECPWCSSGSDSFYPVESIVSSPDIESGINNDELLMLPNIIYSEDSILKLDLKNFLEIENDIPLIIVVMDEDSEILYKTSFTEDFDFEEEIIIEDIYSDFKVYTYFKNSWWWSN